MNPEALSALGVRLVVQFGSTVRGTSRPQSDVDVGVLVDGDTPGLMDPKRAALVDALGVQGEVDLVFLDEAEPLLLFEVATSGKAIFEREEGAFEWFRVRAVKRYFDTAWIRRIEAEALRRRFA